MIKLMLILFYELITNSLSLPVAWHWETLLMSLIGAIALSIAFGFVGKLYHEGVISTGIAGSAIHWLLRLAVVVILWAVLYVAIEVIRIITAYWVIVLSVLGGLLLLSLIAVVAILVRKKVVNKKSAKKHTSEVENGAQ